VSIHFASGYSRGERRDFGWLKHRVGIVLDVPRQQFFGPVNWVIGDALQNVPNVAFWRCNRGRSW
jgi:hypothetical protein